MPLGLIPTLDTHVSLLRQVLSIFVEHQFYPKFAKCKFAQQELTYLGYRIGADGTVTSVDKVQAILLWPDVLANETRVRQLLGTLNYCRMLMGPTYATTARPLVELKRIGTPFVWTASNNAAARRLKKLLAEYTTLQIPDPTRPKTLYTDASGYALGAVLEQNGKPVGFLSQVMSPAQQRYSIYNQELLALVTALDKWRHLLRGAKVTAHTDHQALTYLQHINTHKPLRGRTARWLDFLAEFQDLTVSYLQGARNQALPEKSAGLLQPLLIPCRRWRHVSIDFITDLPITPRGHDIILVIVDSLSEMAHFIPTRKTATTADTVELLADRLIGYHGFPAVLISDRDPRFQSALWQQLCHPFHIKRSKSSAYHPQTDGQTERVYWTLEQMLRTYIQKDESEWERLLLALELAYNITSHSSRGEGGRSGVHPHPSHD
ncbi:hypothetical protein EPH_0018870 [Eimeria praecox]|uniref:Integrase catalytic domain-containing protein n=1 Tax=Eimeria praecox TaxID=51316 RepID=U6H2W9_9EIME|nr:hypothetical protein EPH_0018870 [Eimeria praecox]